MVLKTINSHPEVLESAIHDGIKIFIRDIVIAESFVSEEVGDQLSSYEMAQRINKIAKEVSRHWASCQIDEEA